MRHKRANARFLSYIKTNTNPHNHFNFFYYLFFFLMTESLQKRPKTKNWTLFPKPCLLPRGLFGPVAVIRKAQLVSPVTVPWMLAFPSQPVSCYFRLITHVPDLPA